MSSLARAEHATSPAAAAMIVQTMHLGRMSLFFHLMVLRSRLVRT